MWADEVSMNWGHGQWDVKGPNPIVSYKDWTKARTENGCSQGQCLFLCSRGRGEGGWGDSQGPQPGTECIGERHIFAPQDVVGSQGRITLLQEWSMATDRMQRWATVGFWLLWARAYLRTEQHRKKWSLVGRCAETGQVVPYLSWPQCHFSLWIFCNNWDVLVKTELGPLRRRKKRRRLQWKQRGDIWKCGNRQSWTGIQRQLILALSTSPGQHEIGNNYKH